MIRLTYASTAIKELSPENLLALLKACRTNNGANNITGILLYSHGTFFQVLEGDETAIENTFESMRDLQNPLKRAELVARAAKKRK